MLTIRVVRDGRSVEAIGHGRRDVDCEDLPRRKEGRKEGRSRFIGRQRHTLGQCFKISRFVSSYYRQLSKFVQENLEIALRPMIVFCVELLTSCLIVHSSFHACHSLTSFRAQSASPLPLLPHCGQHMAPASPSGHQPRSHRQMSPLHPASSVGSGRWE